MSDTEKTKGVPIEPDHDIIRDPESGADYGKYSRYASIFGGKDMYIGPRIAPVMDHLKEDGETPVSSDGDEASSDAILRKQIEAEDGHAIQYRTCSWQKTAGLLFSEYICLAIMSFPWSYSLLGLFPGILLTIFVAATVLYTSLVLWKFCLRHPEVRDVCDIGQTLFWGKKWAWWATAAMFILNNTFIQALHVLVGAEYINTMADNSSVGGCRTVEFGVVVAFACFLMSLPRTFSMLAKLGTASAFFTLISVVLATAFSGVQGKPAGYAPDELGEPIVLAFPPKSTTFVTGVAAFLNISYTFIGQITIPSFIAEMREPRDFPKSLWACTIAEIIVFSIVGGVIYAYTGTQYMTAPAFGVLDETYKKVSFSFMIPTILFLGCLYASVTSRFVFFRTFKSTKHINEHTWVGWLGWASILAVTWIAAFIIANVIPFFSSLLSVMSSLFDCWFGFIFWGVAYFRMRKADRSVGRFETPFVDYLSMATNAFMIIIGIFFISVGTYASVQGIIDAFEAGAVSGVFSCASNGI